MTEHKQFGKQFDCVKVGVEELKRLVRGVLSAVGVPLASASVVADVLVAADLRGIESHGVQRLKRYYVEPIRSGYIDPRVEPELVRSEGGLALFDAKNGIGPVAAVNAMKFAIGLARRNGIALVLVRRSNHYGIASYYSMMALEENMIGLSATNTQPLVVPTRGRQPAIGTNPISIAVPGGGRYPAFVLDMSTSAVSLGKVEIAKKSGKHIPVGWGVDSTGEPTADPDRVLDGGALAPLGGSEETAGYKGYGLACAVDILCGVLGGGGFLSRVGPPWVPGESNVCHLFGAVDISRLIGLKEFKDRIDAFIAELKSCPKLRGCDEILVAGEKEFWTEKERLRDGIPIDVRVWAELTDLCLELGIDVH